MWKVKDPTPDFPRKRASLREAGQSGTITRSRRSFISSSRAQARYKGVGGMIDIEYVALGSRRIDGQAAEGRGAELGKRSINSMANVERSARAMRSSSLREPGTRSWLQSRYAFSVAARPLIRTRIRIWSNWLGTISAESSKKGRAVAVESTTARHINQKCRQRKPKTVAAVSDCRGQSVACLFANGADGSRTTWMGRPTGRIERERMSQKFRSWG